jgi:hypothetical protein
MISISAGTANLSSGNWTIACNIAITNVTMADAYPIILGETLDLENKLLTAKANCTNILV